MEYVFILALVMAIFGILGYLYGLRSAIVAALAIWGGLLLIARTGTVITRLANGAYAGARMLASGGAQTLGSSGNQPAALARVTQEASQQRALVSVEAGGPEFLIILGILLAISILIGLSDRVRGPHSLLGLVLGLINGYLVGAFVLDVLFPQLALALPFGLASPTSQSGIAALSMPAARGDVTGQLLLLAQTANERTMAWVIMLAIAVFIIAAIRLGNRGAKA
jgi:hypothetical protein